ncbi:MULTISPECIES: thioredoxin-disulfide reductase [Sphingobacterium]|uniref:thioredoxin-disulfide reductase n=1 Tax=Sphingobacterium TaxID=28453 RepID=UPI00104943AB|nr:MULTISPECIES: thioredoxin-disulfide reductase [Sphingobacterium]MCW2263090.1 thioredoxin reductase (NADPH) [Sphingobacterium kitahiroshimense]TCR11926.1 thioredoxin reductase (NADPH) [Sphingobacterium sp. JUb78]
MNEISTEHVQCLIIGSGPAGYTAAIYAARADLKPVMYTGMIPGGQLTQTTEVDNFPGYPKGITGPVMMDDLRQQAERFGADVRFGMVTRVEFAQDANMHLIEIDKGKRIMAQAVIIATGATAKWLGIESEEKYNGFGVSACAVCDGFFFKNQEVAIVGAGDTAAEEATYLAKMCTTVHMLVRKAEFKASKAMFARVMSTPNIKVYFNTEVKEILGNDKGVNAVLTIDKNTKEQFVIPVSGLFIAIGHTPNTALFKGEIDLDEYGYIKTIPGSTATSIPGVFACGDVQDHVYKQAITAAGTGCMAALDVERYLAYQMADVAYY